MKYIISIFLLISCNISDGRKLTSTILCKKCDEVKCRQNCERCEIKENTCSECGWSRCQNVSECEDTDMYMYNNECRYDPKPPPIEDLYIIEEEYENNIPSMENFIENNEYEEYQIQLRNENILKCSMFIIIFVVGIGAMVYTIIIYEANKIKKDPHNIYKVI